MEIKIIDESERKQLFWIRYETGKRRKYVLHTMEQSLGYTLISDPRETRKKAFANFPSSGSPPYARGRKDMKFSQDVSDETILMKLTNIFFMMEPLSPAFPVQENSLKEIGDFVIGTCEGFLGSQLIQVHGLRKVREGEINIWGLPPGKTETWGVFLNWDQSTSKAQGYSVGLKSVKGSFQRCKRENLSQISCPEDVAMWASTLLRLESLI